ncbi:amyloid-beta A4 precursor protein-binding family A member 2 isoform X5 [Acanthochromis polyacanthus]|uniref:Amyloid beta (A4) precursor protein-binding, family A, member 2b n=1 Tax=Acanthochromis polyacanthus TaxID=80966 RepID=A0A3Q1EUD7_9TELE|nr:amyloid-beta A4 precursor protein-binding family A member 2 isoform X1 [Acanthochromis polyacanthus]XP_051800944.1 amyloid-beta A4 precursor protein-binding family A member 2 isoform X2 [Acanthochromis polyacanthus]XP_051800945.1 amyloid-beta A4 precursor protein-binding family A member 2 isoform X3 [Acanthochromis polyacanthus]XP_051800946.1 amyloid-beta A4 precursor protein-binding family A member 2 isoform X4 [Acanthochromis polyacanthus]XP_051800947.1 amyloid-beta A4 precursor protein-bi
MACKPPIMAQRKRPGTSGGNSMAAPGPASCPTPHPTESCDLKALPARQRPLRYPKESHDSKPHSCKAQYSSPKNQDVGRSHHPDHHPEAEVDAEVEVKRYSSQADAELEDQRPATPSTPEHNHDQDDHDDHDQPDFHGGADSLDDDSSSEYINNTSDEEEDYDDGLAEEDEGVTYYIRYCPEDDSYLEGMDCSSQGNCNHSHSHGQGDCTSTMQLGGAHDDECQEAVEGWTEEGEGEVREEEWVEDEEGEGEGREEWREEEEEVREEWREGDEEGQQEWRQEDQVRQEQWAGRERHRVEEWGEGEGEVRCEVVEQDPDEQIYNGRPEPILDHHHHLHHHHQPAMQDNLHARRADREEEEEAESEEYCPNEEEEEEGDEEERHGRAYTGDYYAPEDNGNSVRVSPYRSRKVLVVEGETGEEAEEDIDQIVAEIKMSMSMGSLSSGTDQSPEELAQDPAPSDYPHSKPDAAPYPPAHHRHDSRPKSLNLPSIHHNNPELQRGIKVHPRSPEDRQRWPQEQVSNGAEQPRKQQRSDLNVPLENNNVPEPTKKVASFPSFVDVPGPCEPEDLIDGIIFAANYLGSTQLLSERNPSKNIRMMQAQEAVSRVKRVQKAAKIKKKASADGDAQTLTEVDLFISTQRIKVLNADSQETMMDNALRTISYIADIGNIVVLMARRRMPRTASQDCIETTPGAPEAKKQYKMICHVFESEDAQLIAQSIGQAFSVAYQEFLRANGINPEDLSQKEYSDIINTQEMYNDDLIHFSNSENCKELQLEKSKGEILGVVIVESGWGSILPTVILANMMNGGPAARSGKLSIGDQIMSINNTSLVGLPLATCQGIIKGLKNQVQVKMNIVSCPPVTTVLIKRPDLKYQLGFSVQNGIICSLMRGGIAERGGVRVGHRIIEINGQSVVATAHEKIVQALSNSVGEIHMKTMPAAMFRLLTGQETPMYI